MSLVPYMLNDVFYRQARLLDQHIGKPVNRVELLEPIISTPPETTYYRPWRSVWSVKGSTVKSDKDKFNISLDVQQFEPDEISVESFENEIKIEAKHEEKKDDHGYISRQFTRRYMVPDGHDVEKVMCELSSDGVLTIVAPKVAPTKRKGVRPISINQTGAPANL